MTQGYPFGPTEISYPSPPKPKAVLNESDDASYFATAVSVYAIQISPFPPAPISSAVVPAAI